MATSTGRRHYCHDTRSPGHSTAHRAYNPQIGWHHDDEGCVRRSDFKLAMAGGAHCKPASAWVVSLRTLREPVQVRAPVHRQGRAGPEGCLDDDDPIVAKRLIPATLVEPGTRRSVPVRSRTRPPVLAIDGIPTGSKSFGSSSSAGRAPGRNADRWCPRGRSSVGETCEMPASTPAAEPRAAPTSLTRATIALAAPDTQTSVESLEPSVRTRWGRSRS
jgi:hypothetical protein